MKKNESTNANEIAIVVGSTGVMGQVIAKNLSKLGLKVLAVGRDEGKLLQLRKTIPGLITCATDISQDFSIEAIQKLVDLQVRIVVHGPGVETAGGVADAPIPAIIDAVNIKVGGLLRTVRAVDSFLQQNSRIIAIGGTLGFEPAASAAAQGICNAALSNLVKQLSLYYGGRSITSHLIVPGPTLSGRLERLAASRAKMEGKSVDAVLYAMRSESPIGEFTTPEQVAWAIETLLSPHASVMTGSAMFLEAGRLKSTP